MPACTDSVSPSCFRAPRGAVRLAAWAAAFLGVLAAARPAGAAEPAAKRDDFMPFVQLAPFVVNGQQLAISIHARSKRDRRYAEEFSEEVAKVVFEAVTPETGKGLVIIGRKGEPHPIQFFRKFLALAQAGQLDPAVAARAPELSAMLDHWHDLMHEEKSEPSDGDPDLDLEKVVEALPLPLAGVGAKLYQLAWREEFDDARVDAKLRALRAADLDGNLFARFDWVFYLPPRGALEQVIDDFIADALKKEEAGFFARTMVKGVMLAVKPKIRRMIEGVRRGLLFSTIVEARTTHPKDEVSHLTGTFIESAFAEKSDGLSEHDRVVRDVRARVQALAAERAKAPAAAAAASATESAAPEAPPPAATPQ